jgi:hypothetical protein
VIGAGLAGGGALAAGSAQANIERAKANGQNGAP